MSRTYDHPHSIEAQLARMTQQRNGLLDEVRVLRSTLEQVTRTLAACCNARDLVVDQRDEWKRRARKLITFLDNVYYYDECDEPLLNSYIRHHEPEAINWFEEEEE